jgi:methionine-rich copper-binding protein CopC
MFRREFRTLAAALGSAAILSFAVTQANAHTELVSAEPVADATIETPEKITLHFNEAIERSVSSVSLADADGNAVSLTPASATDETSLSAMPQAPLAPGVYTVSWTAVGPDTHAVNGTLSFTVR